MDAEYKNLSAPEGESWSREFMSRMSRGREARANICMYMCVCVDVCVRNPWIPFLLLVALLLLGGAGHGARVDKNSVAVVATLD